MISPSIDISEVNGRQWVNLWREFRRLQPRDAPRPLLFLFHEDGRVVKAMLGRQTLAAGSCYPGRARLPELARDHGARRVIAIDTDALPKLWARVEGRTRHGDDMAAFAGNVIRTLKGLPSLGIDVAPPFRLPFLPPRPVLELLWNACWPDNRTVALYVMDGGSVFASLILTKQDGMISRLTSDDGLWDQGIDAARWREDLPRLRAELEKRFGPLWAGWFCERQVLARLARSETTMAEAEARGSLVRTPWPERWKLLERAIRAWRRFRTP